MKRVTAAVLTLACCVTTAAVSSGCTGNGHKHPRPSASKSLPRSVEAAAAPDEGTVRIAESGYTFKVTGTALEYSWGAMLENTSKSYTISSIWLDVKYLDSTGSPIKEQYGKEVVDKTRIMKISPGERKGVGELDNFGKLEGAARPTRIQIELGVSLWTLASLLPKMTVSDEHYERKASGSTTVTFTVDSEYPTTDDLPLWSCVYRDKSGTIIGGESHEPAPPNTPLPKGHSTQQITIPQMDVFADKEFDPTKTKVYFSPLGSQIGIDGKPIIPEVSP